MVSLRGTTAGVGSMCGITACYHCGRELNVVLDGFFAGFYMDSGLILDGFWVDSGSGYHRGTILGHLASVSLAEPFPGHLAYLSLAKPCA